MRLKLSSLNAYGNLVYHGTGHYIITFDTSISVISIYNSLYKIIDNYTQTNDP